MHTMTPSSAQPAVPAQPTAASTRAATNEEALRILLIDDDRPMCARMVVDLKALGCQVSVASTPDAALSYLRDQAYDLAFCDLRLDEHDGLTLLPRLVAANPNLQIVVITAFASYETAVQAMKAGATNYLPKPFTQAQVRELVGQLRESQRVARKLSEFERGGGQLELDLTSNAPSMRAALEMITRAAQADISVLLRGENGTGKGVLARLIHAHSKRGKRPFVTVNCPTLSEDLLASELFAGQF